MPNRESIEDISPDLESTEAADSDDHRDIAKGRRSKRKRRSFAKGVASYSATGNASSMFDD